MFYFLETQTRFCLIPWDFCVFTSGLTFLARLTWLCPLEEESIWALLWCNQHSAPLYKLEGFFFPLHSNQSQKQHLGFHLLRVEPFQWIHVFPFFAVRFSVSYVFSLKTFRVPMCPPLRGQTSWSALTSTFLQGRSVAVSSRSPFLVGHPVPVQGSQFLWVYRWAGICHTCPWWRVSLFPGTELLLQCGNWLWKDA